MAGDLGVGSQPGHEGEEEAHSECGDQGCVRGNSAPGEIGAHRGRLEGAHLLLLGS